jgi:ATP-dependent Clp protease ATP-binding subunit ClpA
MSKSNNYTPNLQDYSEQIHNKIFVGIPEYKSDEFKQLEQEFRALQKDYYKANVDNNKIAHVRARWCLLRIFKLCRPLREELLQHHKSIPRYEDMVHPSWEGVED